MAKEVNKDIDSLREKIDELDREMVRLLNKRAEVVLAVRKIKREVGLPIFDPLREEDILKKISCENKGPLCDETLKKIYKEIIHRMRTLEGGQGKKD